MQIFDSLSYSTLQFFFFNYMAIKMDIHKKLINDLNSILFSYQCNFFNINILFR